MPTPRAEILNVYGEIVGEVRLESGVARLEPESRIQGDFLGQLNVIEPGAALVRPTDGTRYLMAVSRPGFHGGGDLAWV